MNKNLEDFQIFLIIFVHLIGHMYFTKHTTEAFNFFTINTTLYLPHFGVN